MNEKRVKCALAGLQWTLGLVVLVESALFVFSPAAAHFFAKTGLPGWVRPALGVAEMLAAVLFLLPRTVTVGGYSLIVVFGLAAVVHLLHGWFDVGGLLVYAAAALTVIAYRRDARQAV
jgi:thiosulfate reductase cytochrome b subunit